MGWSGSAVHAQGRIIFPGPISYAGPPVNRNWLVAPGVNIRQAFYNTAMLGRAYSYIPPYMLGYNPYPQVVNYGSLYSPLNPYTYSPYVNPYINPYAGGGGYAAMATGGYGLPGYGGGAALSSASGLPYSTGYGGGGYGDNNPYTSPYGESAAGGFLRGTADVINSQGKLVIQLEQAKITKEQAKQAMIDTRRRLFDEIMYERAHTPSFNELREKMAAETLRRSRNTAPITEMWSAKALNDILADLKKLHGKKVFGPDIKLDPDILKQINVLGRS